MSGIWDELEVYKEVLCEMRGNKDFLPTIQAYYSSVRQCELGMGKGPLLFAIMRGKVSEGLDFADNRARGVITVSVEMAGESDNVKYKFYYCMTPESQELYSILASQTCELWIAATQLFYMFSFSVPDSTITSASSFWVKYCLLIMCAVMVDVSFILSNISVPHILLWNTVL
jgi:Rad3-related DNA helicases